MRTKLIGIGLCGVVAGLYAQELDVRGRVVRRDGGPVPGARVELKSRGISASTAADGSFAMTGNSATGPDVGRSMNYSLNQDFLGVDVGFPLMVRMEVFGGDGRVLGAFGRRLEEGSHRFALAGTVLDRVRPAGMYFLRLQLGGQVHIHPFFHAGGKSRGSVFGPAYRGGAGAKRTAVVDSLRVGKAGYEDFALAIASYAAGDLGDLVLSETADDGSICAGQRMQRTSDGVQVVLCEALFDRQPRVRLPAATASSAYAALTADAFVTVAGTSYPQPVRNSYEPEMRRHASALYEIRILDGKVESFRPAVVFADSLFLAPLLGKSFDGLISKRTGANRYEPAPSLPIRMHILAERFPGEPGGGSEFLVKATIANLASPLTAADGACMPGLSSHGSQSPFDPGTDAFFTVGRVPSMHAFGDDELVFTLYADGLWKGSVMSTEWFFTPLDLVMDALSPAGTYTGVGHGAPGTIPMLSLRPASGGGMACSP